MYDGVEAWIRIFVTSLPDGSEWSASLPRRFIPRKRSPPRTIGCWGWVDLTAGLDAVDKFLSLPWIESRSLYCLSYLGSLQECDLYLSEYFTFSWGKLPWYSVLNWTCYTSPGWYMSTEYLWNSNHRRKSNCLKKAMLPICSQLPHRLCWNWGPRHSSDG
jgi:hypothetical protein